MSSLLLTFLVFAATGCLAQIPQTAFKELSYTVEQVYNAGTDNEFEERHYNGGRNFACTNASLYGAGVTKEVMFQAVQDYLQGDNDQDMDIRLSLPVIMIHDLSSGSHQFMVCAFLGEALNDCSPTPTDPKIVIWQPTEKVIYTRRVGTRMTDAEWHMEYQNLKTLLEANGKGSKILNHVYAYATFTPPWTKMADRYEVWIFKNVQVHNF